MLDDNELILLDPDDKPVTFTVIKRDRAPLERLLLALGYRRE